ncbi:hypothetical protein CAPTEDRAFT_133870 [Capitella teleta]|uniref:G-protein coupled receptors family 1 profile domain-containing protein n=1 Tax=Capitella teleta TaxID=283909 RepID=R7U0X1_CAPTE|nr:hypothetical protein CAPTEDRAFT_133870 [Capitella teleta]|eukprot:ELT99843.1 hypothetical protein CAPTEDRAFT_133870 [Capitella teleta]
MQIYLIILFICLILVTCSANAITILCVRRYEPLQKANNLFIISLAVADFAIGIFAMPWMAMYTIYGYWPISRFYCIIWGIVEGTCSPVSIATTCFIAYDRCLAITHPLQYGSPSRKRTILIQIGVTWLVTLLAQAAVGGVEAMSDELPVNECFVVPHNNHILIAVIVTFEIPIVVMVFLYARCLYYLRKRLFRVEPKPEKPQAPALRPSQVSSATSSSANNPVLSAAQLAKRRQSHVRNIRTLGFIIVTFLFCWLPFSSFFLIKAYCVDCISNGLYAYSFWAGYLNSAINPMLYFLSNPNFRRAFIKLTKL